MNTIYSLVNFNEVVTWKGSGTRGLPQSEWLEQGEFRVIGQGASEIEGWSNREDLVVDAGDGLVLYGGHTRRAKHVSGLFIPGPNVKILTPQAELDSRYLRHYLASAIIPDKGYADHFSEVRRLQIPLPPLEEQRRIAAILDKASALEQLTLKQQLATEEAEAHLFLDCLGTPFARLTKWPVVRLSEIGLLERGVSKHRPRNDPSLMNGPYPFIQTGDVAGCHRVIETFNSTYSEKGLAQSRLWPEGTLCITIAANIAKTGILGFEACFPDSVVGFQSDCPALTSYVQCWMGFLQKYIEKMAPESAQKNINLEILRDLQIPLPHEEALNKFYEQALSLRSLWARQRSRNHKVVELNCALSSQLLCRT